MYRRRDEDPMFSFLVAVLIAFPTSLSLATAASNGTAGGDGADLKQYRDDFALGIGGPNAAASLPKPGAVGFGLAASLPKPGADGLGLGIGGPDAAAALLSKPGAEGLGFLAGSGLDAAAASLSKPGAEGLGVLAGGTSEAAAALLSKPGSVGLGLLAGSGPDAAAALLSKPGAEVLGLLAGGGPSAAAALLSKPPGDVFGGNAVPPSPFVGSEDIVPVPGSGGVAVGTVPSPLPDVGPVTIDSSQISTVNSLIAALNANPTLINPALLNGGPVVSTVAQPASGLAVVPVSGPTPVGPSGAASVISLGAAVPSSGSPLGPLGSSTSPLDVFSPVLAGTVAGPLSFPSGSALGVNSPLPPLGASGPLGPLSFLGASGPLSSLGASGPLSSLGASGPLSSLGASPLSSLGASGPLSAPGSSGPSLTGLSGPLGSLLAPLVAPGSLGNVPVPGLSGPFASASGLSGLIPLNPFSPNSPLVPASSIVNSLLPPPVPNAPNGLQPLVNTLLKPALAPLVPGFPSSSVVALSIPLPGGPSAGVPGIPLPGGPSAGVPGIPLPGGPSAGVPGIPLPGGPSGSVPGAGPSTGTSYGPPKDTYGPPKDTYGPPKDTYGPPKETSSPPKDDYVRAGNVSTAGSKSSGVSDNHVKSAALVAEKNATVGASSNLRDGLATPVPRACAQRRVDHRYGNHNYQFSWLNPAATPPTSWIGARNACREQCMDLISLETADENNIFEQMIRNAWRQGQLEFIWTSGRLCDFSGCDRPDLEPVRVNGWFWTGSGVNIAAAGRGFTDWGISITKGTQPDDREGGESCVAMLNPSIYNDPSGRFKWHDIACHHVKPYICEDVDALLGFSQQQG